MFSYTFESFGKSSTLSFLFGFMTGLGAAFGTYKWLSNLFLGLFGICVGLLLATPIIFAFDIEQHEFIGTLYTCMAIGGFVAFWKDEFLVTTTAVTGGIVTVASFYEIVG
jgi:hypothetical protein